MRCETRDVRGGLRDVRCEMRGVRVGHLQMQFFVDLTFRPFSHESSFSFLTSMFRRNLTAISQALENLRWL